MGTPNDLRSRAYFTLSSRQRRIRPTALAPMSGRVSLKVSMASLNPWPGAARTCSAGMRTSSRTSAAGALAELVFVAAGFHAFLVALDDERADALMLHRRVFGREDDVEARERGVG